MMLVTRFAAACCLATLVIAVPHSALGLDCNSNGIPDECDVPFNPFPFTPGTDCSLFCNDPSASCYSASDCNTNGVPDSCEPADDFDNDTVIDICDECPANPELSVFGLCGCDSTDTDSDGVQDCEDGCPLDPLKSNFPFCGCELDDIDSDSDGIADCIDGCPGNPLKSFPSICGCDVSDVDSDADAIMDCVDGCPQDGAKQSPGVCGCGAKELDTDEDGTLDCEDLCPTDAGKREPGTCGCGQSDVDVDGDSRLDCKDACPLDRAKVEQGICGCGRPDSDENRNGITDCLVTQELRFEVLTLRRSLRNNKDVFTLSRSPAHDERKSALRAKLREKLALIGTHVAAPSGTISLLGTRRSIKSWNKNVSIRVGRAIQSTPAEFERYARRAIRTLDSFARHLRG